MPKYTVRIAMDVRSYGTVEIDAESPEKIADLLTAEFVADNFTPHGSGSDDFDFSHPSDIWAESCVDVDGENEEAMLDITVPNGQWMR